MTWWPKGLHILLSLRAHGWTRQPPANNKVAAKGKDPFYESFRFVLPGYNVGPLELSGALGRSQIKKLPSIVRQRRKNARQFLQELGDDARFQLQEENGQRSWFGFSMIVNDRKTRREQVLDRLREASIEVRPIVSGNFL